MDFFHFPEGDFIGEWIITGRMLDLFHFGRGYLLGRRPKRPKDSIFAMTFVQGMQNYMKSRVFGVFPLQGVQKAHAIKGFEAFLRPSAQKDANKPSPRILSPPNSITTE